MDSSVPYTRISRRINAFLIDIIALILIFFLTLFIVIQINISNSTIESLIIFLFVGSVEPLCISFTGSSIGHHLAGLKVRQASADRKLNIFQSYVRFLAKLPLGLFSFISVLTTSKHQALHDLLSKSIVVHKDRDSVPAHEIVSERIQDTETYAYPSILKKALVTLSYLILFYIVYVIAFSLLINSQCLLGRFCSNVDSTLVLLFSGIFWVGLFVIVGLGWQARLFGCRKKLRDGTT